MWEIYHFVIKNMNSHECTEDQHHFFVITLILVSIPVQSLSALMAYHLTCQHVKFSSSLLGDTPSAYHLLFLPKSFFFLLSLFILLSFFHILCRAFFYVIIIQSTWKFPWSFVMSWSFMTYYFFRNPSCMTSCRRHFVIFRFSHVIGYIF